MERTKPAGGDPLDGTAVAEDDAARPALKRRGRLATAGSRYAIVGVWALLIALFGILAPDTFLTTQNLTTILGSQAVLAVLTLGLLIPLTVGDYDLSVASVLSLASMIVAILNVQHGWPVGAAIAVAILAGLAIGFVNGAFVVLIGVDSLIITLAMGTMLSGAVLWISDSQTIAGVSSTLVDAVVLTKLFGVSLAFYYALVCCIALWYVFDFTPLGRRLLFVGRGRNVARLVGVRVGRVRWGALIASAGIAALAGVIWAGTTGAADPTSGATFLLPAFAAAFLGATSIVPGQFNPWGSFIAVYFLVTGITGLQLLGAQAFVQELFYGGALAVAVAASQLARRHQGEQESAGGP